MNTQPSLSIRLLITAAILLLPSAARAQLLFSLTPLASPVSPGSDLNAPVPVEGTLTNLYSGDDLVLDSIGFSLTDPAGQYLTTFDTPFFDGTVPFSLTPNGTPGATYDGPLFLVGANALTPDGDYGGTATIIGHYSTSGGISQEIQTFQVSVGQPSVPEAQSYALVGIGGTMLGLMLLRRRRFLAQEQLTP